MIKGRDFIFVGLQSWDISIGSNCKNLATEIARHNRVLYVSKPLDRISLIKNYRQEKTQTRLDIVKGRKPALEKVRENLWNLYPKTILESVNWIDNRFINNFFNKINIKRLVVNIEEAIQTLNFSDVIVFNDNDFISYQYLKEYLSPEFYLYYIRDNLISQTYFEKRAYLEEYQIKKADAVVTNSEFLNQYAGRYNSNTHFVGQGYDTQSFLDVPSAKPVALTSIPGPLVGYTGLLSTTRLDLVLLEYLADQMPDISFVLIGPEDLSFQRSILHQKNNVFFPGAQKPEAIPQYIQHFDVCINPQALNPMTIGNYPRKIDEYLMMGKPVVATKTLAMEYFQNYTYLAVDKQAYVENIQKALKEDNIHLQEKRKRFAQNHTWEESVNKIYKIITHTQEASRQDINIPAHH